jgi:hypothetical protein
VVNKEFLPGLSPEEHLEVGATGVQVTRQLTYQELHKTGCKLGEAAIDQNIMLLKEAVRG